MGLYKIVSYKNEQISRRREKGLKEIFEEIMDEKVSKLMQGINPQIQEA